MRYISNLFSLASSNKRNTNIMFVNSLLSNIVISFILVSFVLFSYYHISYNLSIDVFIFILFLSILNIFGVNFFTQGSFSTYLTLNSLQSFDTKLESSNLISSFSTDYNSSISSFLITSNFCFEYLEFCLSLIWVFFFLLFKDFFINGDISKQTNVTGSSYGFIIILRCLIQLCIPFFFVISFFYFLISLLGLIFDLINSLFFNKTKTSAFSSRWQTLFHSFVSKNYNDFYVYEVSGETLRNKVVHAFQFFYLLLNYQTIIEKQASLISKNVISNTSHIVSILIYIKSIFFYYMYAISQTWNLIRFFFVKHTYVILFLIESPIKVIYQYIQFFISKCSLWRPLFKRWSYFGVYGKTRINWVRFNYLQSVNVNKNTTLVEN